MGRMGSILCALLLLAGALPARAGEPKKIDFIKDLSPRFEMKKEPWLPKAQDAEEEPKEKKKLTKKDKAALVVMGVVAALVAATTVFSDYEESRLASPCCGGGSHLAPPPEFLDPHGNPPQ